MFGLASVLGTQHRKVKTRERGVSGDPTASERGSRWGWKADNRSPRRLLRSGWDCGENDCNEVGCGGVQNIQELTQATAAVGVAVFFIVRHPRNQRLATTDPGLAEVGAQFLFKMSGQRVGPPKFQFQRTEIGRAHV